MNIRAEFPPIFPVVGVFFLSLVLVPLLSLVSLPLLSFVLLVLGSFCPSRFGCCSWFFGLVSLSLVSALPESLLRSSLLVLLSVAFLVLLAFALPVSSEKSFRVFLLAVLLVLGLLLFRYEVLPGFSSLAQVLLFTISCWFRCSDYLPGFRLWLRSDHYQTSYIPVVD